MYLKVTHTYCMSRRIPREIEPSLVLCEQLYHKDYIYLIACVWMSCYYFLNIYYCSNSLMIWLMLQTYEMNVAHACRIRPPFLFNFGLLSQHILGWLKVAGKISPILSNKTHTQAHQPTIRIKMLVYSYIVLVVNALLLLEWNVIPQGIKSLTHVAGRNRVMTFDTPG